MSVQALSTHHLFQQMDEVETSPCRDYLFDAVGHSCYFMFHAVFGIFLRVIALPLQYLNVFYPDNCLFRPTSFEEGHSYSFIDSQGKNVLFTPAMQTAFINRINVIAQKMDLKKPVTFCDSIDGYPLPRIQMFITSGTTFSSGEIALVLFILHADLAQMLIDKKNHEVDYLIARELSHVTQNHELYQTLYDTIILVVEVACAILLGSVWALLLIEGTASVGRLLINQIFEKDADLDVIAKLGTSQGAVREIYEIKERLAGGYAKDDGDCFSFIRKCLISPTGDFHIPNVISANSLSARLKYMYEAYS